MRFGATPIFIFGTVAAVLLILVIGIIGGVIGGVIASRSETSQNTEISELIDAQSNIMATLETLSKKLDDVAFPTPGRATAIDDELVETPTSTPVIPPETLSEASVQAIVTLEIVASDLAFPVAMAFAPDGRIFFTELKTGSIRVMNQSGEIVGEVANLPIAADGDEQGLLGLAIDPSFDANGFLYAY